MILPLLPLVNNWVNALMMKPHSTFLMTTPKEFRNLIFFLKFLFNSNFSLLMDIWGSDYPQSFQSFEINFMLLNLSLPYSLMISMSTDEYTPMSTVSDLYNSAGWLESEVWDMYGVYFLGHKDLSRMLTDYGFSGYPLSKDFPLTGYTEVRYDDTSKQVVLEPLEISQELRLFNFKSPWENNYLD